MVLYIATLSRCLASQCPCKTYGFVVVVLQRHLCVNKTATLVLILVSVIGAGQVPYNGQPQQPETTGLGGDYGNGRYGMLGRRERLGQGSSPLA